MDTLIRESDQILDGFYTTLWLLLFSLILSTVLGTVLASFRVAPITALRGIGTASDSSGEVGKTYRVRGLPFNGAVLEDAISALLVS